MKKVFLIIALSTALSTISVNAQQQRGDSATMMARMKERIKPQLIEKAKITGEQADKVIEINFEMRQQLRALRDLNEDERKKKADELRNEITKKYKSISLTDDQAKAVNEVFEEMRKNMPQRNPNGAQK